MFYRCRGAWLEYAGMSDQPTCRKSFKYKLQPTREQKRELERVVLRCRQLYNVALDQRMTA